MSAYIVARIQVVDPERFEQYRTAVTAVIARYGGRYLVRSGEVTALEGAPDTRRVVILEFSSFEAACQFWTSPDYACVKKLRDGAAEADVVLVPGL